MTFQGVQTDLVAEMPDLGNEVSFHGYVGHTLLDAELVEFFFK